MKIEYKVGDMVRITGGAFAAFTGRVAEVSGETHKIKVEVVIFGRKKLVEFSFGEVEKLTFTGNLRRDANPDD